MEDVFLNVASIAHQKAAHIQKKETEEETNANIDDVFDQQRRLKGVSLWLNRFAALFIKGFFYTRRIPSNILSYLVIPIMLICLCFYTLSSTDSKQPMFNPLKLDLRSIYGETQGFYQLHDEVGMSTSFASTFKDVLEANGVSAVITHNATGYVLKFGEDNLPAYLKNFLLGGSIGTGTGRVLNLTAWYNGQPYHVSPISLNVMHTSILRHVLGSGKMTLTNAPLSFGYLGQLSVQRSTERVVSICYISLALAFFAAIYVRMPMLERVSRFKLLQLMTGIPPVFYWAAMFLYDYFFYLIVVTFYLPLFAFLDRAIFAGGDPSPMGAITLLLYSYGWAAIPFSYLISFLFKKPNSAFSLVVFISLLTGTLTAAALNPVVVAFGVRNDKLDSFMNFMRLFPSYNLGFGFGNLFAIAYNNAYCDSVTSDDLKYFCNEKFRKAPIFYCCKDICGDDCVEKVSPLSSLGIDRCSQFVLLLLLDGIIYFLLLLLIESSIFKSFFRYLKRSLLKLLKKNVEPVCIDSLAEDAEVIAEAEYVDNLCTNGLTENDALVSCSLTKEYRKLCAVNKLSFSIHHEECFGLLGVNGAGKTTTFKMLTGDVVPSTGNAFIMKSDLVKSLKKFQSYLGYCPQFDAFVDILTGREVLILFARLRGFKGAPMYDCVEKLIKLIDLQEHAMNITRVYSGGNKRKLSLGVALIGGPPVVLLDEPTTGVDPASRRKIWNILSWAKRNARTSIVLTTHSMEESEALCDRLAIMVNGKFCCLGSIQQLKSKYGKGYTVIIKLKKTEMETDSMALSFAKEYFQSNVPGAQLKDDHQGTLQYHVVDTSLTLGHLFKFMDGMKEKHKLEDYLISDASLEQIFLTFARLQRPVAE